MEQIGEMIEEKRVVEGGDTVLRRYQKGRFLGKGGFARCYEVKELDSGRLLAAKVIEKATLSKGRAKQKLLTEVQIHRAMVHNGIVRFETYFEDSQRVYIMLELCPNQTLKELLKRRHRLHFIEVQYYALQLLSILNYLHSHRVIHRDLKLGNLFLGAHLEPKLGDFGLAARLDFVGERRKTVCGTPNYIAPEVLNSRTCGHSFEADIWSFGVVLYTLLVGKPPFETSSVKMTYRRIRANDFTIPDEAGLSTEAKTLIKQILVPNPADRPTLDQISRHPFLTTNSIPPQLPMSSLFSAPPPEFVQQFVSPDRSDSSKLSSTMSATNATAHGSSPVPKATEVPSKKAASESSKPAPVVPKPAETKGGNAGKATLRTVPSADHLVGKGNNQLTSVQRLGAPIHTARLLSSAAPAPSKNPSAKPPSRSPSEATIKPTSVHVPNPPSILPSALALAPAAPTGSVPPPMSTPMSMSIAMALTMQGPMKGPTQTQGAEQEGTLIQVPGVVSQMMLKTGSSFHPSAGLKMGRESSREMGRGKDGERVPKGNATATNSGLNDNRALRGHEGPSSKSGGTSSVAKLPSTATVGVRSGENSNVYVSYYVDHTDKYGVGYVLTNGTLGFYYNDMTNIVWLPAKNQLAYSDFYDRREKKAELFRYFSHEEIPKELEKKVKIMDHFIAWQQKLRESSSALSLSLPDVRGTTQEVAVKRVTKTRNGMLFRLTNNVVHMAFLDQSQIVLCLSDKVLVYISKKGVKQTMKMSSELLVTAGEKVVKRFKYTLNLLSTGATSRGLTSTTKLKTLNRDRKPSYNV